MFAVKFWTVDLLPRGSSCVRKHHKSLICPVFIQPVDVHLNTHSSPKSKISHMHALATVKTILPCCSTGSEPSGTGPSGWDGSSQRWRRSDRRGRPEGRRYDESFNLRNLWLFLSVWAVNCRIARSLVNVAFRKKVTNLVFKGIIQLSLVFGWIHSYLNQQLVHLA